MKNALFVISALLLGIILNSDCFCQEDSDDMDLKTVSGVVVSASISGSGSSITIKDVNELTLEVISETSITKDGENIELSAISQGDYVMVGYYEGVSGKLIAASITLEYTKS